MLDLGASGWDEAFEASEDPAGVGIFCLAPREVTIRSNGKMVTIKEDGWTGAPVSIFEDPQPVDGTRVQFRDEEWNSSAIDINAVFCGMKVIADGRECPRLPFVSEKSVAYTKLGCRIEVRQSSDLKPWHHSSMRGRWHGNNVLVNFHGQVVAFAHHPVSVHGLHYLIDMTGGPTDIRLMLPARTQLVDNETFAVLKDAMELEGFRYVQRQDHHALPYKEYLRAKQLGIDLPEAKPTYSVGMLGGGDPPDPVEVVTPKEVALGKCYRFDPNYKGGEENDEANVHLLAALGKFDEPFVPVSILGRYDGYSWAKLPTIDRVEVAMGRKLHSGWLWSGTLTCVDSITVTAHASDGRVFSSKVCMAMAPAPGVRLSGPSDPPFQDALLPMLHDDVAREGPERGDLQCRAGRRHCLHRPPGGRRAGPEHRHRAVWKHDGEVGDPGATERQGNHSTLSGRGPDCPMVRLPVSSRARNALREVGTARVQRRWYAGFTLVWRRCQAEAGLPGLRRLRSPDGSAV